MLILTAEDGEVAKECIHLAPRFTACPREGGGNPLHERNAYKEGVFFLPPPPVPARIPPSEAPRTKLRRMNLSPAGYLVCGPDPGHP